MLRLLRSKLPDCPGQKEAQSCSELLGGYCTTQAGRAPVAAMHVSAIPISNHPQTPVTCFRLSDRSF